MSSGPGRLVAISAGALTCGDFDVDFNLFHWKPVDDRGVGGARIGKSLS